MKIIDISREICEGMTTYKNNEEKKPVITQTRTISEGSNECIISMNSHTGTHIDAPYHIFNNGKKIDELPLEYFYGKCKVFDLTSLDEKITKSDLDKLDINENDIVLFKTKNSFENEFDFDFVYLDKIAAQYLVDRKIKTVGIDSLGIERNQPEHETHKLLLRNNIPILEGLDLQNAENGEYTLCCFPLKLNIDGSPVRAVLIK
jgi:arylformamidase